MPTNYIVWKPVLIPNFDIFPSINSFTFLVRSTTSCISAHFLRDPTNDFTSCFLIGANDSIFDALRSCNVHIFLMLCQNGPYGAKAKPFFAPYMEKSEILGGGRLAKIVSWVRLAQRLRVMRPWLLVFCQATMTWWGRIVWLRFGGNGVGGYLVCGGYQ